MNKVKYDIGFVVDYKFNKELPYTVDFYSGTLVGENVFMKDYGIEHIYEMEIEAYSPKHALQIATDSITGNKCFELYNHYTGDIECVETTLLNGCIGFIDEHLHNEFGEIEFIVDTI